ncbi:hypothetical protein KJ059_16760 [Myxococcota bacterium]|nr:hypothetical protein [Myxococcota bacterium]MCZ7617040.1 hypothetical protein [Myxococcota bacterium]
MDAAARSAANSRPRLDPAERPRAAGPPSLAIREDCAVCGSPDISADEAMHRGLWLLGECGRCGYRWTAGPFDGPLPAPASVRPVAAAPETAHIVAA